eukprot:m.11518 g.11518  ORF g.11518 m.11518 type:complete len:448 (-) comp5738_c0_seq1:1698-3041(-)
MKGLLTLVMTVLSLMAVAQSVTAGSIGDAWNVLDTILQNEISNHSFPGCVALVANATTVLYAKAFGNFTYGNPPPMNNDNPPTTVDTLFDLASLTKVLATTTAAMTFYQRGELNLNMLVSDEHLLGSMYAQQGKGDVKVLNLMLHNAGYPPDPSPEYWSPEFGCPATTSSDPPEVFSCNTQVFNALLNQTLVYPTGSKYIYSDLSMITMMYVVGTLARRLDYITADDLLPHCAANHSTPAMNEAGPIDQCYYEAYVRKYVLEKVPMPASGFLPDQSLWSNTMPTWNDTTGSSPGPGYRNRVIQGQVSDQNAYALGGIAGHAGLFSTAVDIHALTHKLLFAEASSSWINSTTVRLFTTVHNETQSSRALGWDTNNKANTYRGCGNLSPTTFTHTGYTGTETCNDPQRGITTILLTNRVYPKASDESEVKIHLARQRFNNAIAKLVPID